MMIDTVRTIVALLTIAATGHGPATSASLQKASPAQILATVAARGKDLLIALRQYSYDSELTIQTISQSDTITGKYYRFSRISFDRDGNRQEKVLENISTLPKDVYIGSSTANNLTLVYQFIITPETMNRYEMTYVGRERIDELNTFVFDVKPTIKLPDPEKSYERYLKGRVWIDDQDMCVVKVVGQALPGPSGQRAPQFETYFQNYDSFWFPAYTSASDRVRVGRYSTHVIVNLRLTGYKKASSRG